MNQSRFFFSIYKFSNETTCQKKKKQRTIVTATSSIFFRIQIEMFYKNNCFVVLVETVDQSTTNLQVTIERSEIGK